MPVNRPLSDLFPLGDRGSGGRARLGKGLLLIMSDAAHFLLDKGIPAFEDVRAIWRTPSSATTGKLAWFRRVAFLAAPMARPTAPCVSSVAVTQSSRETGCGRIL
jgi:hypothetical protein